MSPLPPPLEGLLQHAMALRDAGDTQGALRALDDIDTQAGGAQIACDAIRGGILWELGRPDEGATALRRVLRHKPRHALASRILTHCLLESGALTEAREEAERYLRLVDTGEAERAPQSLKQFYRDIAGASDAELDELARSLRSERSRSVSFD